MMTRHSLFLLLIFHILCGTVTRASVRESKTNDVACARLISHVLRLQIEYINTARNGVTKYDKKCLAPIAKMVRVFGMGAKIGCSSPLVSTHFLSQKL